MSKWFEVKVTKVTVYAVQVEEDETADDATQFAIGEHDFDDVECSAQIVGDVEIDCMKRHADHIYSLE